MTRSCHDDSHGSAAHVPAMPTTTPIVAPVIPTVAPVSNTLRRT
jgi:hypothetical protein